MSKEHWAAFGYALVGSAMTLFGVIERYWIEKHLWIMWPFSGGAAIAFFMAGRQTETFRRFLWKAFEYAVPYSGRPAQAPEALNPEQILREKVLQLGHDLFAFILEKGPEPKNLEEGATQDDFFRWMAEVKSPFSVSVLHAYELRFKQRATALFHEFGEKGLKYDGIGELGSLTQVNSLNRIETIARACFNIAKEIDIEKSLRPRNPT